MSKQPVTIYQHADHPEWGHGVVVSSETSRPDRLDLSFDRGGRRTILKSYAAKLTVVPMSSEEAAALGERLASRRSATAAVRGAQKKKPKGAAAAASFATFQAQLAHFDGAFPGGFRGEKFEKEERGLPDARRRKTDKGPAVADAARLLSAQAFAQNDETALMEAATTLVRTTSFVHPLEGANSLGSMKPEHRGEFVAALRELLHGSGDEGDRFERFVASIKLEEANGTPRRPSWPLATVFAALLHPTRHVCVKPTFFQKQAALMRVPLDYQPLPSASVYAQFLAVTRKTEAALREAGHDPRDLVDVASFICLTQGAKPEAKD